MCKFLQLWRLLLTLAILMVSYELFMHKGKKKKEGGGGGDSRYNNPPNHSTS